MTVSDSDFNLKDEMAAEEYVRQEDLFRDWVTQDGSSPYPVVAGRYHLYVSLACPWAHRTIIARKLLGLEHLRLQKLRRFQG